MGYQNEVIDDLKFLHERVEGEPRVVVFVDDLDRCSDESIMETLQAINLVLGASDFFVVLAIDPDMIHRAIARQRGISDDDEAAEVFAENYLRKIIQLPLVLPGRSAEQRFGFVSQLFSPRRSATTGARRRTTSRPPSRAPDDDGTPPFSFDPRHRRPPRVQILREVQDTKEELEALHASRDLLNDNPRELKRLVNVHRLVKILLQRPDAPPTPSSSASSWPGWSSAPRGRPRSTTLLAQAAERPGRRVRRRGRGRVPLGPGSRRRRHAGARRPDLAARPRPAGGYSPADRSGVRSSGSASSISFVKMRSLRL